MIIANAWYFEKKRKKLQLIDKKVFKISCTNRAKVI